MAQVATIPEASEEGGEEIEAAVFHAKNCAEDIALVRNQGLMVDDNNDPAPENIPVPGLIETNNESSWGWDGTCNRKG